MMVILDWNMQSYFNKTWMCLKELEGIVFKFITQLDVLYKEWVIHVLTGSMNAGTTFQSKSTINKGIV
jgi:hypothetical protein